MKYWLCAALMPIAVFLCCPCSIFAAADVPPQARHASLPHICDSGPNKGCPCVPTEDHPQGICSDLSFFPEFVFEPGPNCVPFILPQPRAAAFVTAMFDDQVNDYDLPLAPPNRAFTILIEVTAPDGRHLLSATYQNLADPTSGPDALWQEGGDAGNGTYEPVDSISPGIFFGNPNTIGIQSFLREFKPLLWLAPEARLAERLRQLFNAPQGSLPVIISNINDPKQARFEDATDVGASDIELATVVRVKVTIGFISPNFDGAPSCGAQP